MKRIFLLYVILFFFVWFVSGTLRRSSLEREKGKKWDVAPSLLQSYLSETPVNVSGVHLIVLGDSTSSKLAKGFAGYYSPKQHFIGRCNLNNELGLDTPRKWMTPNRSLGEGPLGFGLHHPACRDCTSRSCVQFDVQYQRTNSSSSSSSFSSQSGTTILEDETFQFLVFDTVKGREIQTPHHKTTQEVTLYEWLAPRYEPSSDSRNTFGKGKKTTSKKLGRSVYVILNVGLHDVVFGQSGPNQVNETITFFQSNLRWLFQHVKLSLPNAEIIWHGFAKTKGKKPQTYEKLTQMNAIAEEEAHRSNFHIVNFWNASSCCMKLLSDNVHHKQSFYNGKARVLWELIQQIEKKKSSHFANKLI